MLDPINTIISLFALAVSGATAWISFFRKGSVLMTKPTFVAFLYDTSEGKIDPKIFIRTLLYSTGHRGHVIENMFLKVSFGNQKLSFNIWGHSRDGQSMQRGSGLFVDNTGIAANHHFNSLTLKSEQRFKPGNYKIDIFLSLVGKKAPLHLHSINLEIPETAQQDLLRPDAAMWFDWKPDLNSYHARLVKKPNENMAHIKHNLAF